MNEQEHAANHIADHIHRVFPPFDFSYACSHIFWLLIFFGCFYYFILKVIAPKISDIIELREGKIASDFDHALCLKNEADDVVSLYEKELNDARLEAIRLAKETEDKIKEKLEKERKKRELDLKQELLKAQDRIDLEFQNSMKNFNQCVFETTNEILIKVLDKKIPEDRIYQLIQKEIK